VKALNTVNCDIMSHRCRNSSERSNERIHNARVRGLRSVSGRKT
jgi:hypothetical protein